MAAQFTEITLEEMERYLKRGWHALRPKQVVYKGEISYDLFLSAVVSVRVMTSIGARSSSGAGAGEDAIRVTLFMPKQNRPMLSGKMPIVKRTQGWKNSLQDRIEDMIETYEDREDYFEERAGGHPEQEKLPIDHGQREEDEGNRAEREMAEREMRREEEEQARQEAIQRREEEIQRREEEDRASPTPLPSPRRTDLQAMYRRLPNGDWGLQVEGEAQPGDRVLAITKGGQKQYKIVGEVISMGRDRYSGKLVTLTTIANPRRTANDEEPELAREDETYSYEREA